MSQLTHLLAMAWAITGAIASFPPQSLLPLPPMGFNNWARFMTNINESIFLDAAEAMTKRGLLNAGYNRINLDDAWSTMSRAADKSMVWDAQKFPRGLQWLAFHLKSRGFIPGIYTDSGWLSCGGYPGALGYEGIDLRDFTAWGFEFLKVDGCNLPDGSEATYHQVYGRWDTLLSESGSRMVFSDSAPAYFSGRTNLTEWHMVMGWAQKIGHLARHSADIQTYPDGNAWGSMMFNYDQHVRLARYQKPGFFNDPDFLNVDHPSYTFEEKKSHFALWCVFSAPLLLSADLTALSNKEVEYLTNRRLIAVNQDRMAHQATLVSRNERWDVLTKSVENGDRVVAILNKGVSAADHTVSWERLGLSLAALQGVQSVYVQDLWTGKHLWVPVKAGGITSFAVPSHGTAVYRISQHASLVTPSGLIFNSNSLNCLTDQRSGQVRWAKCDGSDSQTWKVRKDGQVSSLLRPEGCIVQTAQGLIAARRPGRDCDGWTYYVTGNLVNNRSKLCLTEGAGGVAFASACGYLLNEQVFSLPVGTPVIGA